MLPLMRPQNFVPSTVHPLYKIFFTGAAFHGFVDVVHQTELPALIFSGSTVLPWGKFSAALLIRRQDGQIMFFADLVTDAAKLAQGVGILAEFFAIYKTDRVDHEVGMDVLGIAVRADLHFIFRPCFFRKHSGNLMRLLGCDLLPGMEGLNILVEVNAIQFVVGSLCCQKLCDGIAAIAVDTADQSLSRQFIHRLLILGAVIHHGNHGTEVLLLFLDVGDCRHQLPLPMR